MKIDVEGHETEVLRGAIHTLSTLRPVCQIELNTVVLKMAKKDAREMEELLLRVGYRLTVRERERDSYSFYKKPAGNESGRYSRNLCISDVTAGGCRNIDYWRDYWRLLSTRRGPACSAKRKLLGENALRCCPRLRE
jgi:hypothetical protein